MTLLIILVVLALVFGVGGRSYGGGRYATGGYSIGGLLLLVLIVLFVTGFVHL